MTIDRLFEEDQSNKDVVEAASKFVSDATQDDVSFDEKVAEVDFQYPCNGGYCFFNAEYDVVNAKMQYIHLDYTNNGAGMSSYGDKNCRKALGYFYQTFVTKILSMIHKKI